ncbi:hypothetical protein SD71_07380 [Cohnella kolymensis]|uniref:DoxX family protein n=1 Tax=Cohnella kolymensis TaxID=1590652 RepID=A0ABR5A6A4_9BACL|nr:hypothetical protein SD71_07380 [Cohnella kolymensis]
MLDFALAFLMAGSGKIAGSKMHVDGFTHWRLPQWFRVVTGLVEAVGAVALIIGFWEPSWIAAGSLLLTIVGVGGVLTHIRVKDPFKQLFPILLLSILSLILFLLSIT